jgi:hypothetical protein
MARTYHTEGIETRSELGVNNGGYEEACQES